VVNPVTDPRACKDRARADKTYSRDNLRRDAGAVGVRPSQLLRKNREHRCAETNKHICTQPGRLVAQLPLQPDYSTEDGSHQQTNDGRGKYPPHLIEQHVHLRMKGMHRRKLISSGF
jgi:hypothetical protein